MEIGIFLIALIGGLGSFFNPCSIVMIPSFIAFVGAESSNLKKGFFLSVAYGLGFTLLFTAIGMALLFIPGFIVKQVYIQIAGGIIIIIMGILVATGILTRHTNYVYKPSTSSSSSSSSSASSTTPTTSERISIEGSESSESTEKKSQIPAYSSAFLLGISNGTSGLGCAGPILAGVISAILTNLSFTAGIFALALYGIGLIVPFLFIGLFLGKINEIFLLKIARISGKIKIILGMVLIGLGMYFLYKSFAILVIF